MELTDLLEAGWLRREASSTQEIADLLGIVERGLADAEGRRCAAAATAPAASDTMQPLSPPSR